jgi:hypothetical protein
MAEYRIIIKLSENAISINDLFQDEFIQKINALGLQYGGIYNPETQIHSGVIDFISDDLHVIEKNIKEIQLWLISYPIQTILHVFFPLTSENAFLKNMLSDIRYLINSCT